MILFKPQSRRFQNCLGVCVLKQCLRWWLMGLKTNKNNVNHIGNLESMTKRVWWLRNYQWAWVSDFKINLDTHLCTKLDSEVEGVTNCLFLNVCTLNHVSMYYKLGRYFCICWEKVMVSARAKSNCHPPNTSFLQAF